MSTCNYSDNICGGHYGDDRMHLFGDLQHNVDHADGHDLFQGHGGVQLHGQCDYEDGVGGYCW